MRRECLNGAGTRIELASAQNVDAAGVPARLYRPAGGERAMLIWMHGGAWMFGDLDCSDAVVRAMANEAGCAVLSVDYRLVPEHRFPAAVEDCWTALKWAQQEVRVLAVGGDSSGGNLAAVTALRARDAHLDIRLQVLVYPVLDYRVDSAPYREFAELYDQFAGFNGYGRSRLEVMRYIWEEYAPDSAQRASVLASPLRASSLAGVAPAFIVTAEHDILRDETEEFRDRLSAEGVVAEHLDYKGQVHGFFPLLGLFADARDAASRCGVALRRAFTEGGAG
jgi:acetyl esterase